MQGFSSRLFTLSSICEVMSCTLSYFCDDKSFFLLDTSLCSTCLFSSICVLPTASTSSTRSACINRCRLPARVNPFLHYPLHGFSSIRVLRTQCIHSSLSSIIPFFFCSITCYGLVYCMLFLRFSYN